MEYLRCLFRFKNYSTDKDRKTVVYLNCSDRTRTIALSESGRYLILWERGLVPSDSSMGGIRYTELNVEVITVVYDLENNIYYPIPQHRMVRQVKEVKIEISPDEKTAMIQINTFISVTVIWWNLKTRNIIRTIDTGTDTYRWTITNEHLVCMISNDFIKLYSPIGETSREISLNSPGINFNCRVDYRNGEIIMNTLSMNRIGYVYNIEIHPIDKKSVRTLTFENVHYISIEPTSNSSQINQYLSLLDGEYFSIIDMNKAGEVVLKTEAHQDLQDWKDQRVEDTPMSEVLRFIVFQKQTLIKVLEMVLSAPLYDDLPETLQYMVRTTICS